MLLSFNFLHFLLHLFLLHAIHVHISIRSTHFIHFLLLHVIHWHLTIHGIVLLLILHLLVIIHSILVTHELIVLSFILIDLLQEILDVHILSLNFFQECITIKATSLLKIFNSFFVLSNLNLKCLDFFSLVINFLKKDDIFRHDLVMIFFVYFLIFLKHLSQVVDIVFEISSLTCILSMKVSITSLILNLFLYVFLVKTDDTRFKLFKVSDMMKAIKYIIFELFLEALLFIQFGSKILYLIGKTLLSHSEIIDNQSQVLIDSIEMSELLSHLISLLI